MAKCGIWSPSLRYKKRHREKPKHLFLEYPFQIRVRFPWQSLDYYEWPHVWKVDLLTEDCFGKETWLKTWYFNDKQAAYNFYADEYWYDMQFVPSCWPVLSFTGACSRYDELRDECWEVMHNTHEAWKQFKESGYEDESLLTI